MMKIKSKGLVYTFKENKNTIISPLLELYRGKSYSNILKSFINDSIKCFGKEIFSVKKSCIRTLTNILSGWMFSLYSDYNFNNDPFLPDNFNNTKFLKLIFNDLVKFDDKIKDAKIKIDYVLNNLINSYEYNLKLLENYKKSKLFCNNKNKFSISKYIKKKNNEVDFYKLDLSINFILKDSKINYILDNIYIPIIVYERLLNRYSGPEEDFINYIWIILFRYNLLGSNNHQLGILPSILDKMKVDLNLNFECFASGLNSFLPNYCSIYYDIEKFFGSKGSFFNLVPEKGTYSFNPPYQIDIINKGVNKLFTHLLNAKKNKNELNFIITIPIWDKEGKKIIKEKYGYNTKIEIDYGNFNIMNKIKESEFFSGLRMVYKDNFTYLDHKCNIYKDVTIQNTYVIVLSTNKENNYIEKINQYNFKKN
jgi:hypothetical protein